MSRESPATIVAAIATLAVVAMFSRSLWMPSRDHDAGRAAAVSSPLQPTSPADTKVAAPRDALQLKVPVQAAPTKPEEGVSHSEAVPLWFAASGSATVGSTVDLATGTLHVPDTTAIEVSYDPAVLHARSTEERDYRDDAVAYGGFHVDDESPGLVRLIPRREVLNVIEASGRRAGLVQFEPLAMGASRIEVRMVPAGSTGAVPRFAQPSCDCDVIVLPTP
jgi:hypothetical protein